MPNHGGRYVIRNGKRERVTDTAAPTRPLTSAKKSKAEPKAEPAPAVEPASAPSDDDMKEPDNG